ncbi:MAG: hypothetical protein LQ341_002852 [Variospora aurantia]|nr:MAG: hypothetical protein LQ341_002852 [Variospora aurantia]
MWDIGLLPASAVVAFNCQHTLTFTGVNTTSWTVGSTLLALGLSVGQAMAMVIVGCVVIGILAVLCGWLGSHHHVGFTVASRSAWGMRGAFWPVLNRVMTGCVWMGVQMYWGGLAVRLVLNAIIGPRFVFMANTLPASANIETANLICFFIFVIALIPLIMVPPERLQLPFHIAFAMITSTLVGMLLWSLIAARGAGDLLATSTTQEGSELSWNMLYGMQSFIGGWLGGVLGQSDWTRYSRHQNGTLLGQSFAAPLTICLTAFFGLLITSAASALYGQIFWNPFLLLLFIQSNSASDPATRAGTFFAGLGLLASQMSLCIVLNSVSAGMDLTTLAPQYINIRRGAFIILVIGIAIVPWNLVNTASTFLTVIQGWSVFLAPMIGVLLADYFAVRRRTLHLADLYIGSPTSVYWYTAGFNFRAVVAWAMGLWPLLPGFVRTVRGEEEYSGWDNLVRLNVFIGLTVAFVVHFVLHTVLPARGSKGDSPFVNTDRGLFEDEQRNEGRVSAKALEVNERSLYVFGADISSKHANMSCIQCSGFSPSSHEEVWTSTALAKDARYLRSPFRIVIVDAGFSDSCMDPVFKIPTSPGLPLFPVSPERANRQALSHSPSLPSNLQDPFKLAQSQENSDVKNKVAQFNSLSKEAAQRRKDNEAAMRRAVLGREEAENETRRLKEENRGLRKELEEGRARENRVAERIESVMEELHRTKETQAYAQGVYEKEVRRARKEAFRSSSAVVKLQEELKTTRNRYTLMREEVEAQKRKIKSREEEAFAAESQLVGLQEELETAKRKTKVTEEERDALKTILQQEEVARIAAEGKIALPPSSADDEFSSPKKRRRESVKENVDPKAMEIEAPSELDNLKWELRMEKSMRIQAASLVDFMKMECQFRCCSCRIAEEQGVEYINDGSFFGPPKAKNPAVAPKELQAAPPPSIPPSTPSESIRSIPHNEPSRGTSPSGQTTEMLIDFSPSTYAFFRNPPTPSKNDLPEFPRLPPPTLETGNSTMSREEPTQDPVPPMASQPQPLQSSHQQQFSASLRTPRPLLNPPPHRQAPHTSHPTIRSVTFPVSKTITTTVPLAPIPVSPDRTISRDEALAQIQQRRGRARSAVANATPRRPMSRKGTEDRRDLSAPAR